VIRVAEGDTVYFHVTNLEQDIDITHGFGILNSNVDMQVEPGETKTAKWVAKNAGVTPMYCSNFCSALHQEMQGYIEVAPAGTKIANMAWPPKKQIEEVAALLRR
jgi:nitrous-oxide reductase